MFLLKDPYISAYGRVVPKTGPSLPVWPGSLFILRQQYKSWLMGQCIRWLFLEAQLTPGPRVGFWCDFKECIPRNLSDPPPPSPLAAVLTAVVWSGKTKVKQNERKSSEFPFTWLSVTGLVYVVPWCVRVFLLRMINVSWRSTGCVSASKGEVKHYIQLSGNFD